MANIAYRDIDFKPATLAVIAKANEICADYQAQGYSLTLRQLYYQFVARGLIANKDTEYHRLGGIINDARLAGMLDWDYIVDRTRKLNERPHWGDPEQEPEENAREFVENVMPQFRITKWATQPLRMEVWIEKDALVDVIARPSNGLDLPYFACRGYNSQSNAWAAAQRVGSYYNAGAERVVILHLGDHDPSGIDMSRDIEARFREFLAGDGHVDPDFEVRRIALNMDQVRLYNPPPNPAKLTDSRARGYIETFGKVSWELDALDPPTIDALIRSEVEAERDGDLWEEAVANEKRGKDTLALAAERWADVVDFLEKGKP